MNLLPRRVPAARSVRRRHAEIFGSFSSACDADFLPGRAWANLERQLHAAGVSLDNIVKVTT